MPSSRAGFTLIEAAVAVTIVGLAAVASLAAFGAELRAGDRARTALEVEALLEEQLSLTRLLPTQSLISLPDSLTRGEFLPPFERYAWSRSVRVVPGTPGLFDVTVRVRRAADRSTEDDSRTGEWSIATRLYRSAAVRAAP